jgi:release factor glutamine methyltransferase
VTAPGSPGAPAGTPAGTVGEALAASRDALGAAGAGEPGLDAELLLAEATGLSRAALVAHPEQAVDPAAARRFGTMLRRRLQREPLAYVLGRKGFRRIELEVDSRVLVPRPETEMLVELAHEVAPRTVLDVGTGSGAIALAIADELPGAEVAATDVSGDALDVARANAVRLGLGERVAFERGTLPAAGGDFDLLVANLPYVAEADWRGLAAEIARYEPRGALIAGVDGLGAIRGLLDDLAPGEPVEAAVVGLEIGSGQGQAVAELLAGAGYGEVEVRADLAGLERVVVGRRPR